jgi:hypothetical protein
VEEVETYADDEEVATHSDRTNSRADDDIVG